MTGQMRGGGLPRVQKLQHISKMRGTGEGNDDLAGALAHLKLPGTTHVLTFEGTIVAGVDQLQQSSDHAWGRHHEVRHNCI